MADAIHYACATLRALEASEAACAAARKAVEAANPGWHASMPVPMVEPVQAAVVALLDAVLGEQLASWYLYDAATLIRAPGGTAIEWSDGRTFTIRSVDDLEAYARAIPAVARGQNRGRGLEPGRRRRMSKITDDMMQAATLAAENAATLELAGWDGWGVRPRVDNWPEVVRAVLEAVAPLIAARERQAAKADWYWRQLDHDEAGDSIHEALRYVPDFVVCHLGSSINAGSFFAARVPVLDRESDDTEELTAETEDECRALVQQRIADLRAAGWDGGWPEGSDA